MIVSDEQEMIALGMQLALQLNAGDIVAVDGPLGAGKTVLCRGILLGLGYTGEVSSPSYAFVNIYDNEEISIPVVHADLYRIKNSSEVDELGLFDDPDRCITLIEWASLSKSCINMANRTIVIQPVSSNERKVTKTGFA